MDITRKTLTSGVELIAVGTEKFKTSLFSVTLMVPLDARTATANALVGEVLYRGSERHPDMETLAAAEDELYGAVISPSVCQRGELQCIALTGSFLDDACTLDGRPILEPAVELMGEILLRPATEGGIFRKDYVTGEGANLADLIRSQVNEKRGWSIRRLIEEMCRGEAYAIDKYGFAGEAEAMESGQLWARYQALLREARVVFYYGGSAPPERVEDAVRTAFGPLLTPREPVGTACPVTARPRGPVRTWTDRLDVTQGKLALGFRAGGVNIHAPDYPALMVCNAMYGGTASSRLFLNVREKLSLCYFADSLLDKLTGLMVVSSGVEFADFQVAQAEILAQLDGIKAGTFTDEELRTAKLSLVSGMRSMLDSQGRMESFWVTQRAAGEDERPEALIARLEAVTAQQVQEAAKKLELDGVYRLTGLEG